MSAEQDSPIPTELPQEIPTMAIFPIIRKATGLRLREGSEMEYALSLVTDTQPQINLLGINGDRITPDQTNMVIEGIRDARQRFEDLRALKRNLTPATEKAEHDWQK